MYGREDGRKYTILSVWVPCFPRRLTTTPDMVLQHSHQDYRVDELYSRLFRIKDATGTDVFCCESKCRLIVTWLSSWDSSLIDLNHYNDVIMSTMASQITSLTIVYSTVYSGADQRKHQSSASLAFVLGIHRWPVNSLHKGPVTRKMFPFDDVIMHLIKHK